MTEVTKTTTNPDEIVIERTTAPIHQKNTANNVGGRSYSSIKSKFDLNESRCGVNWCSNDAAANDTIREGTAYLNEEYVDCWKFAIKTRARRIASCILLTPISFVQASACCVSTALCCCFGCAAGVSAGDDRNVRWERDLESCQDACKYTGKSAKKTAGYCGDFFTKIVCCLPNCCFPECADSTLMPINERLEKLV